MDYCRSGSLDTSAEDSIFATSVDEPNFDCENPVAIEAGRYESSSALFDIDLGPMPSSADMLALEFSPK